MSVTKFLAVAAIAVVSIVVPGNSLAARADEIATVVNESDSNIELFLKWSHLPNESAKIVLRPGDEWRTTAPAGQNLFMRFNSTPAILVPNGEVRLQVRTANVPGGAGAGYKSTFKQKNPHVVVLTGP